jgi:WD40 repeat protein
MSPADRDEAFKYWAFISYSSADRDHAVWLINALERYRIPGGLVGRQTRSGPVPKRLFPVFRDRDELRSGADLKANLESALRQSRFLIVLCSPRAARPASWVDREIRVFKALGRKAEVLALIIDGEPNASARPGSEAEECFPQALRYDVDDTGRITGDPVEPLAADIRREDRRPRVARRKALLKLIASIIDVDFDDLWRRAEQRRRRVIAVGGIAAALVMIVIVGLLWTGVTASRSELSVRLADQAKAELATPHRALLLSVAAFETAPTAAAYGSLLRAVEATPHLLTSFSDPAVVTAVSLHGEERQLAVARCPTADCTSTSIHLYDLDTGRQARLPFEIGEGSVTDLAFHPAGGDLLAVESAASGHRVVTVDPTGRPPEVRQIYRDAREVTRFAWSRDGGFYAIAVSDGGRFNEYKLFPQGEGRRCGDPLDDPITAMAFAPDAGLLALGGEYGPIVVVDTATCASRRLHPMRLGDLTFDPSGSVLVAIMPDGTTTEWDLEAGSPQQRHFPLIRVPVDSFLHAFSPDGALLASKDGTDVLLHDVATTRGILERLRQADDMGLVEETALRLWLDQLQPIRLRGHADQPEILRFSTDGRFLATAGDRGTVLVWDVAGASLVKELDLFEHGDRDTIAPLVPAEALSPDGRIRAGVTEHAAGCTGDHVLECRRTTRLTLRDARTGEIIETLEASRQGLGAVEESESFLVRFDPDGDVITAAVADDGRVLARHSWKISPAWLVAQACQRANRELRPDDPELRRYVQGWRSWLVAGACQREPGHTGR